MRGRCRTAFQLQTFWSGASYPSGSNLSTNTVRVADRCFRGQTRTASQNGWKTLAVKHPLLSKTVSPKASHRGSPPRGRMTGGRERASASQHRTPSAHLSQVNKKLAECYSVASLPVFHRCAALAAIHQQRQLALLRNVSVWGYLERNCETPPSRSFCGSPRPQILPLALSTCLGHLLPPSHTTLSEEFSWRRGCRDFSGRTVVEAATTPHGWRVQWAGKKDKGCQR